MIEYIEPFFYLVNEMSPYLLLGFLIAGLLHVYVPKAIYNKHLSKNNFRSVLLAALFGVPLPLCSCGVIPTAMSLRREGASRGSVVSFLIATPQTGVDSIFATFSLMGLPFAIIRPIVALATALFGGAIINKVVKEDETGINSNKTNSANEVHKKGSFASQIKEVANYAFVDMMQDVGKWLVVGLIAAGLITILVPDDFFNSFIDNPILSMLLVLLLSIPMYICATGSIPIAVALMIKGLSPGAALVLLMAGPATNIASILVVGKVLGRRTLILYLLTIIFGAIIAAIIIDYFLPAQWFVLPSANTMACCHKDTEWWKTLSSIVFILILVNAFIKKYRRNKTGSCSCGCHDHDCEETSEPQKTYKIEGMTCNHCRANVEKAILSVEGVEKAQVSLEHSSATIIGNFSEAAVKEAVESIGFTFISE